MATINVKTSHLLETSAAQWFQVKQLMSFFYDIKTTAYDGWTTFGLNDSQNAAFLWSLSHSSRANPPFLRWSSARTAKESEH